ncbi:MAG: sensor histidine kinase [Paracoccaceae bacterium]
MAQGATPATSRDEPQAVPPRRPRWLLRLGAPLLLIAVGVSLWITNDVLTQRFTETTRQRAELRLALYVGNLTGELNRAAIVPELLGRDPLLIGALATGDFQRSTQRLLGFVDEIGAASLMLMDRDGRIVAATDRRRLGETRRAQPFFIDALRSNATVFSQTRTEAGAYAFHYSRRVEGPGGALGVIAVEVDLGRIETSWAGVAEAVLITDSEGTIVLASEPRWRGQTVDAATAATPPGSAIERAIRATRDWAALPIDAYLRGEAVLRVDARVPFQGWRMTAFTTYASVRERVNAVLALQIMGFAIAAALAFWLIGKRVEQRARAAEDETAQLRALNARLNREIASRRKAEQDLEVAERTVAQTSKLAALGEMSAAVSHELNQPLAAMRTYLAGARLLLERARPEEAMASFRRIDDLIARMGAITRQLKSYARRGAQAFEPLDMRASVNSALAMMEPQLGAGAVRIERTLPEGPAMVTGDRLRIEQVIVNLLRNALDATRGQDDPKVEILLVSGDTVRLQIADNGPGIADFDALFEPFYTTKSPGEGTGLGLAISAGIASDMGGRLTARQGEDGGAVFELSLPAMAEGAYVDGEMRESA